MIECEARIVKAFTKDPTQGNPAGVILQADSLSVEQMIRVSAQLGFSESAFVQKSEKADYRIRFCTPTQEVDLCGHATIATFHALMEEGIVTFNGQDSVTKTQESKAGMLPVICYKDGLIFMTQKKAEFFEPETNISKIALLLNISPTELMDYPIQTVSTGTPKLIIPVKSHDVLFSVKPDLDGIVEYCNTTGARGFYPFTFETGDIESDFHARQFNPLAGINEDPITGVAAGALGAYIVKHSLADKNRFVVEQGYNMNKAGKMIVEVGNANQVGGYAVNYGNKVVQV